MSIFDKLREGIFKIRVIPKDDSTDITSFEDEKNSIGKKIDEAVETGKRIDLTDLLNITTLKGDRNTKYAIYEEMVSDGRIGAAIEMYANDTVQYNQEGKLIWVESNSSDVAQFCNNLIEDLNIPENLWSYAYCLWLYGDVYLELFKNTSINNSKPTLLLEPVKQNSQIQIQKPIAGAVLEKYIEKVPNPADVYDLQSKGKTSGFIRNKNNVKSSSNNNIYSYSNVGEDIEILSPTKFVHICLSPNINRFPEVFNLIKEENKIKTENGYLDGSNSEGSGSQLSFQVKTGQSILENVYGPYQTLKLKEESVLLERITKSSITRVIQLELGDLPEAQKKIKLQELKDQIEQQLIMNKETGSLQSRAGAQPVENIIYTTTKDGKGTISTVNIGGDAEIGNLDDITQSENKVFGSLLTPKAVLGADMDGTGLSNGGSLTELNTTYARRIKRGQSAICNGIKNLINIFALDAGIGDKVVNNFTVKLTPIITVEDNRRDELMQTKIRNITDIMSLIDKIESITETTKLQMLLDWLGKYLNQQDIVDIINAELKKIEKKEQEAEKKVIDDKFNDEEYEPLDRKEFDSNIPIDEEEPEEVDIAEIEGEDLV